MSKFDYPAPAGREALKITRDDDWERVVRGFNRLPKLARESGVDVAVAWAQAELQTVVSLIDLAPIETPRQAKSRDWLKLFYTDGVARVLVRGDRAGFNARVLALRCLATFKLDPTFKWVFSHSPQNIPRTRLVDPDA